MSNSNQESPGSIEVEVNLKIPGLTVRQLNEPARIINNQSIRFLKIVAMPTLPAVGSLITVTAGVDVRLDCGVTRVEWSEAENRFVVSCTFARRTISSIEYQTLSGDPTWRQHQLPM